MFFLLHSILSLCKKKKKRNTSIWCVKALRECENTFPHKCNIMTDHICFITASSAARGQQPQIPTQHFDVSPAFGPDAALLSDHVLARVAVLLMTPPPSPVRLPSWSQLSSRECKTAVYTVIIINTRILYKCGKTTFFLFVFVFSSAFVFR